MGVLVVVVRLGIVCLLAVAIANTILFFLGRTDETNAPPGNLSLNVERPLADVDKIVRANLFGNPESANSQSLDDLAATRLNLSLIGIVYNESEPSQSRALIKQYGRDTREYQVGGRVGGGAQLHRILRDRVVLTREGQQELLAFEAPKGIFVASEIEGDPSDSGSSTATTTQNSDQAASNVNVESERLEPRTLRSPISRDIFSSFEDRMPQDPRGAIMFDPDGSQKTEASVGENGYVIASGSLANRLGLKKGDIIRTVNGLTIGNQEIDYKTLQEQLNSGSTKFEIRRGKEVIFVEMSRTE